MDGYAVDATNGYPLELVDVEIYLEDEPLAIDEGRAVPIATSAVLLEGADAVLTQEEAAVENDTWTARI